MKKRLGEMLVSAGLIDEIQLTVALGMQKQNGLKLGKQLLKLGFVTERQLSEVLREQLGISISLLDRSIPPQVLKCIPSDLAFRYQIMPLAYDGKTLVLACADPADLETLDAVAFKVGKKIRPVRVLEWEIESALLKHYHGFSDDELGRLTTKSETAAQYQSFLETRGNEIDPTSLLDAQTEAREEAEKQEALREAAMGAPPRRPAPARPPETQPPEARSPSTPPRPPAAPKPAPRPGQSAPHRPAPSRAPGKPPVQAGPLSPARRATLQQALIELLIEKNILTERELLERMMKLERSLPDEER
jgi:hypothetical protein